MMPLVAVLSIFVIAKATPAKITAVGAATDESALVQRLRSGDETAFVEVVRTFAPSMTRVARSFVSTDAHAADVVQEAWSAVLDALDKFEGRSSLKTWVLTIVANRARSRAVREARTVPLPFDAEENGEQFEPACDPARFNGRGYFCDPPVGSLLGRPDDQLLRRELGEQLNLAIAALPQMLRQVVLLRDVEGLSGAEVSEALGIEETHERVLLHRARSRLRGALENYHRNRVTQGGRRPQ